MVIVDKLERAKEQKKELEIMENAEEGTCQFCGRNNKTTMTEDGTEVGCDCR